MTEAAPRSGWLKPLLLASLMINLLVAGAIAGRFAKGGGEAPWRGGEGGGGAGLSQFARTLPPERARVVREALREERGQLRGLRQSAQEARAAFARELAVDKFDRQRVEAAAAAAVEAERKVRERMLDGVTRVAERLTPAERQAFAERLKTRQRMWMRRGAEDGGER